MCVAQFHLYQRRSKQGQIGQTFKWELPFLRERGGGGGKREEKGERWLTSRHPWRQTHANTAEAFWILDKKQKKEKHLEYCPFFCLYFVKEFPLCPFTEKVFLKYNEASLYIGSKWNHNNNNIILKQNKTTAEWFALFDKVSTVPAASSCSSSSSSSALWLHWRILRSLAIHPKRLFLASIGYHVTVFFFIVFSLSHK